MTRDAIRIEALHKDYVIGSRDYGYDTLRERLSGIVTAPIRKLTPRHGAPDGDPAVLHALRDVTLRIAHGEIVGLIGRNGAGKSTLLKVLSRITEPTSGWAEITGRVGSLLEVGTGFHPELTGRENIFLNGAVLGMRRAEIRRQFDQIVDFADVERFLDTPVKRYSSGMSVRLAFSVAAHLQTEVLIVDEVLAVGDAAFQRKSLARMTAVAQEGRTVLFVSHNMAVIQALCQRGIFLQSGQVQADAPVAEAIAVYLKSLEEMRAVSLLDRADRSGWHDIMLSALDVSGPDGAAPTTGQPARITVTVTGMQPDTRCTVTILDHLSQPIARLESANVAPDDRPVPVTDLDVAAQFVCDIDELPLVPGRYSVDVLLRGTHHIQDQIDSAAIFDVEAGLMDGRPVPITGTGNITMAHRWTVPTA